MRFCFSQNNETVFLKKLMKFVDCGVPLIVQTVLLFFKNPTVNCAMPKSKTY